AQLSRLELNRTYTPNTSAREAREHGCNRQNVTGPWDTRNCAKSKTGLNLWLFSFFSFFSLLSFSSFLFSFSSLLLFFSFFFLSPSEVKNAVIFWAVKTNSKRFFVSSLIRLPSRKEVRYLTLLFGTMFFFFFFFLSSPSFL